MVKAASALSELRTRLFDAGIENAAREAAILLSFCADVPMGRLRLDRELTLPEPGVQRAKEMANRRVQREPLQYILGEWDFLGRRLLVRPGVLIPRPETELLAEYGLSCIRGRAVHVLDLCCGSGCLSVALAAMGGARVTAGDISPDALSLTADNAALWEVADRVEPISLDARSRFSDGEIFDLMVCNPPYIPTGELSALQPEVRDYEPALALDGGEDGLLFYREIMENYGQAIKSGGMMAFETGMGQARAVELLLQAVGFVDTVVLKDYAGIERIAAGRRA